MSEFGRVSRASNTSKFSARSESSRARLVMHQQHDKLKNKILLDLQRKANVGGLQMRPEDFIAMQMVASDEASRQLGGGGEDLGSTVLLGEVHERRVAAREAAREEQRAFLPAIRCLAGGPRSLRSARARPTGALAGAVVLWPAPSPPWPRVVLVA
jgi:hypothetical protein